MDAASYGPPLRGVKPLGCRAGRPRAALPAEVLAHARSSALAPVLTGALPRTVRRDERSRVRPALGLRAPLWARGGLRDDASQPLAGGTRRPETHDCEMLVRRLGEQPCVLPALARVRSQRCQDAFRCSQELPGQPGALAGPGRLGPELRRAPASSLAKPPQADAQRVVEPDDRVGPWPDQVAHRPLVAVGHPSLAGDRSARALAQEGKWCRAELRAEVQRVELHVGYSKGCRKLASERCLARSSPADDNDPLAAGERVHRIAQRPLAMAVLEPGRHVVRSGGSRRRPRSGGGRSPRSRRGRPSAGHRRRSSSEPVAARA